MKRINQTPLLVLSLALSLGIVGCKTRPKGITPIPPGGVAVGGPGPGEPVESGLSDTMLGGATGEVPLEEYEQPENRSTFESMNADADFFAANTVYFDFDSATIKPSETAKIEEVAKHLRENSLQKLRVEGHCDERGTEQYNLALGDRRAAAVREYLINLGIAPDRIQSFSYGEEKPVCFEKTEACYAKNRRSEFILLTP